MSRGLSPNRLPAIPLAGWVQRTLEALGKEYDAPDRVLADRLGISERQIYCWKHQRNSEMEPAFSFKAETVEDALARGEVQVWEVFPWLGDREESPLLEGFCSRCDEAVTSTPKGRCHWCDGPIGPLTSKAERVVRHGAICLTCRGPKSPKGLRCRPCSFKFEPRARTAGRSVCPGCGGKKAAEAVRCWTCYIEGGGPKGRRQIKTQDRLEAASEAVLKEAYELYDSGLSLPEVIDRIWERVSYSTKRNALGCLTDRFKARGWPLRSKSESQRLRYERQRQMAVAA